MKPIKIVLISVFFILLAGGYYVYKGISGLSHDISPYSDPIKEYENQKGQVTKSDTTDMTQTQNTTKYVPFDETTKLDDQTEKKVLFFYASWCPTCRPVDTQFRQKVSEIPDGVKIIRVNYNDPDTDTAEKALAQKYGVTYQHTFVQIDSNGNEIVKWNGGGLTELLNKIR